MPKLILSFADPNEIALQLVEQLEQCIEALNLNEEHLPAEEVIAKRALAASGAQILLHRLSELEWPIPRETPRKEGQKICLDFDGVVHSYTSGWHGADLIKDDPVPGAFEFISELQEHGYTVVIHSTRTSSECGRDAIRRWMTRHGCSPHVIDQLEFAVTKPPAMVTIDDRAICFDGTWPDLDEVERFVPWNKKES